MRYVLTTAFYRFFSAVMGHARFTSRSLNLALREVAAYHKSLEDARRTQGWSEQRFEGEEMDPRVREFCLASNLAYLLAFGVATGA